MIRIIPAEMRHFSDFGWLKSYWLFSFSNYYDPDNIQFGDLRVFNDDTVEPGKGFPSHSHSGMEIVTLVLEGEITHEDSMGNKTVLREGEVQCISTGPGIEHSEFNSGKKPLHFYQIWIYPDRNPLSPAYSQKKFEESAWENWLLPLVSGQGLPDTLEMNADSTIYRARLEKGKIMHFDSGECRRIFIYVTSGEIFVNGQRLKKGDQARTDLEKTLHLEAVGPGTAFAEFVLLDLPSCKGMGYGYDEKILKSAGK
ncbi:pirin family protein [Methanosarcina sp. KYL-1]|uniref:pirin family protein n=1 Tax=Methanosarcina sp. KYL-1 TaxID=2602068 RepID=UPI002100D351|nr:pirin-like bicupin family protein [Methanosarcina sp. KYL-1]MCQ1535677.1 pirin family protein [Methanosarcina sp. KYL-1]